MLRWLKVEYSTISFSQKLKFGRISTFIYVSGGKGACSSFIDRCFAFIGENAVDTVKTPAFCNLPKDALIKLISSDYLGLEEEDVWRAVLNWAKYQVIL